MAEESVDEGTSLLRLQVLMFAERVLVRQVSLERSDTRNTRWV